MTWDDTPTARIPRESLADVASQWRAQWQRGAMPAGKTCALCGERDAADWTEWDDGRIVPGCGVCLAPVPETPQATYHTAPPPPPGEHGPFAHAGKRGVPTNHVRIVADLVRRFPGLTRGELGVAAGVPDYAAVKDVKDEARRAYDRFSQALQRAVKMGLVRRERQQGEDRARHYPVRDGQ